MATAALTIKRVSASSYSANFVPENVLVDKPDDSNSRWTGAYHNASPLLRHRQWLKLELESLSIVKTITFGKFRKAHPCNMEHFKVYGSSDDSEEMIEILQATLKNDDITQTYALKHHNEDGVPFPCRFIKIVPLTPAAQTFNMSIWHVSVSGVSNLEEVQKVSDDFTNYRETVTMRLVLKHLRRRRYKAYQSLLEESGLSIEHPLVSELYESLVTKGDLEQAESIFTSFADSGLLSNRLASVKPTTVWTRIFDTSSDGLMPSPRGGHVSVIDTSRGIMYLFGGWDGVNDMADFWAYSIPNRQWTELSYDTSIPDGGADSIGEGGIGIGPSARSCGAATFDPRSGDIYFLGRYVAKPPQHRQSSPPGQRSNQTLIDESGSGGSAPGGSARTTLTLPRARRALDHDIQRLHGAAPHSPPDLIGSGSGASSSDGSSSTSDFYRYSTRGPNEGKWEQISRDTASDGGPELAHDLAMVMDSEAQVLYVYGGEVYNPGEPSTRYGGLYSYTIQTGLWMHLFSDPLPSQAPNHRYIPSRYGHSMIFDPDTQRIFIVGGQRGETSLNSIFTYHVKTGEIAEMTPPDNSPRPKALQMLRATYDDHTREIFVVSGLVSANRSSPGVDNDFSPSYTTLWIYSIDENTWSPIIEPSRNGGADRWEDYSDDGADSPNTREPRPRLGHTVVFDPGRRAFFAFGGNAGGSSRLNDFWSLSLIRPVVEDVLRKGKLSIRRQRFVEMCSNESTIVALQYLQSEISAVVDHQDEEESAAFRGLLSLLLSRPSTPILSMTTPSPSPPPIPDASASLDDSRMHDLEGPPITTTTMTNGKDRSSDAMKGNEDDELHKQRTAVFDRLLTFVDPRAKQPKADLVDLVRVGMDG